MTTAVDIGSLIVSTPTIRRGRPRIAGTRITVQNIVRWYKMGLTPEEMIADHPHVPLAGIYAALAYYHANREEIDREIEEENTVYSQLEEEHARLHDRRD